MKTDSGMVLWVTQRPHCPALCPVGHSHEKSQGDGDFRGLRYLEVSVQRGVSHEIKGVTCLLSARKGFLA